MAELNKFGTVNEPEWLFAWHESDVPEDDPSGDRRVERTEKFLTGIRGVSTTESELSEAGAEIMGRCLDKSGYSALRRAGLQFAKTLDRLKQSDEPPMSTELHNLAQELQRDFKMWLSTFRAFDDRTSSWLSANLGGKRTPEFTRFKELLSYEFDHNFAYRLCAQLRNIVEHQDDVLSITLKSEVDPATNEASRSTTLHFDPEQLVRQGKEMRAATREELRQVTGHLNPQAVMSSVDQSCELVHCGLVNALWPRIESAIALTENFQTEVEDQVGTTGSAVFVPTLVDFAEFRSRPRSLPMRTNPLAEARTLRDSVRQRLDVMKLGSEYADAVWQDFVVDDG